MAATPVVVSAVAALALVTSGCAANVTVHDSPVAPTTTSIVTTTTPPSTVASTSTSSTSTSSTFTTSTSTTSTTAPPPSTTSTTSTTSTSTTTPTTIAEPPSPVTFDSTVESFDALARSNPAVALSVWRDGEPALQLSSGTERGGAPLTTRSPMVIASVSKLVTALTVARLAENDVLDVGGPVPWAAMGFDPHPGWADVTVRELLDHTSGMPVAQSSWLDDPGSCAVPLTPLLSGPPTAERGRWRYSNGNYCALGLMIEAVTGARYDVTGTWLVFGAAGVEGPRLTVDGPLPTDGPHARDIARLDRLGAAGSWLAGSDHVAAVLASVTDADRQTLRSPGVFVDQYGWGHTGTVDGAKACAWVVEEGRTVVVAIVSGGRPGTGGGVCDAVLPPVGADLGLTGVDDLPLGEPDRSPP